MEDDKPLRRGKGMNSQGTQQELDELTPAKLGPEAKIIIGRKLGEMYAEILKEGVPDRHARILRGLDDPPDGGSKNESP
jgi:hypothetical protein